jgi:hypothetical protein
MLRVISASRRTDLVASFDGWLAEGIRQGSVRVHGPSGHTYTVDITPDHVHTFVLWSKDFAHLLENCSGLLDGLQAYRQLYLHFTITGLGGSAWERGVIPPEHALAQLDPLVRLAGDPRRISVRFDPVVFWTDEDRVHTNLHYFESLAPELARRDICTVRISFAQWYRKAQRRAEKYGAAYVDPEPEDKLEHARTLAGISGAHNIRLFACSQDFLTEVPGIEPSACIDGRLLRDLHPEKAPVPVRKDKSQRKECRCTESIDIGSYTQSCPQSCLYCYANPSL